MSKGNKIIKRNQPPTAIPPPPQEPEAETAERTARSPSVIGSLIRSLSRGRARRARSKSSPPAREAARSSGDDSPPSLPPPSFLDNAPLESNNLWFSTGSNLDASVTTLDARSSSSTDETTREPGPTFDYEDIINYYFEHKPLTNEVEA